MLGVMRARLYAKVDQTSGTCVPDADELDPISCGSFPVTEGERERGDLVWCLPCGHLYFREGIVGWRRVNPTYGCPLCRTPIQELIPYGTSEAAYEAGRLAREAERARVREELEQRREAARQQARVDMPHVRGAEMEQVGRFRHMITMDRAVIERCDLVGRRRVEERRRHGRPVRTDDRVWEAQLDVCEALSARLRQFCRILSGYINEVSVIRVEEVDSLDPDGRFMLDDVARRRRENAELVVLIDYIRAHEPRVLNAGDYEAFVHGLEVIHIADHVAAKRVWYVGSLQVLIDRLRELDDVLDNAGRPPRPSWQTPSEFLDSVPMEAERRGYRRGI